MYSLSSLSCLAAILCTALVSANSCNHDNCLRAFIKSSSAAGEFCSTFTQALATSPFPSYAKSCTSGGQQASRISSACSCINTASTSQTQPSSTTATTTTTTTTTTASSTAPTSTSPACTPTFVPVGVDVLAFNPKNTPFTVKLSCSKLDVNNYTAFANYLAVDGMTATADGITFPGFAADYVLLSIFALDMDGVPIFDSFQLLFGSTNMPVLVLSPNGQPAAGVTVTANATTYAGVGQTGVTDATGKFTFSNLISTTISLVAQTADNEIGVNGIAATTGQVTLQLVPLIQPAAGASFDIANGTSGWTGGTLEQSLKKMMKRDTKLVVSTNAQYSLQTASNSFPIHPFTKTVYIKYQFITAEVPGGYFGTQYNDYFSVTIRTDTGAYASITNSMNELGLGAFDAGGATQVYTLTMVVPPKTKFVEYNIGVSNVADNLLDSEIVVSKTGDLTCDQCGDCSTCPGDPMCQPTCESPPLHSCNFYRDCAEGSLDCGAGGYPLKFGESNCHKFVNNLAAFSPQGVNFVWGTMHCLQQALVPILEPCTANCDSLATAAFASHAGCYVANGFCTLPCHDYLAVVMTVGKDLFTLESVKEMGLTAGACLAGIIQNLKGACGQTVTGVAEKIALQVLILFLESALL